MPLPPALVALLSTLPADIATDEPSELREYGTDRTRIFEPRPTLLVRPRTSAEVSRVLAGCHAANIPVVPSGGRTGLAGGAVAKNGEVVLSLERMRALGAVDTLGMTLEVEAGATTEAVHQHAEACGLYWPIDFASKGSATVGGNIATNAGGVRVIRYGLTRSWVLGLRVVLADGTTLALNGALEKNNTGIDLRQLFIGSEGILGVITSATLKLTRAPSRLNPTVLLAIPTFGSALRLFEEVRASRFETMAFEYFSDQCMRRVERYRGSNPPFSPRPAHYVLIELEGGTADGELDEWLGGLLSRSLVSDGIIASDSTQRRRLWALREDISEALTATGVLHKNDIALPIARLEAFCGELETLLANGYPSFELCVFGHIGDGNLHINIMKPEVLSVEAFRTKASEVDGALFALVQAHHGSISAEHGIGLLKRPYLHFSRSDDELALMRGLKAVLDPKGILNPEKVLPWGTNETRLAL